MNTRENCLRALGNLVSMAIDNTKGSKAVDICHKEISAYIDGLETENNKVWQRYKEEHNGICKGMEYLNNHIFDDGYIRIMPSEIEVLFSMLRGE